MSPGEPIAVTEMEFLRDARARREVGLLLAEAFTDAVDAEVQAQLAREAHWGDAPITRIVQRDDTGHVIGHVALFEIKHNASPPHRVIGIGDLVIHIDHRGHGLGSRLINRAVDSARITHHADVIFARSTSMQQVFKGHGFESTWISALSREPGWLGWSRAGRLPRYRWLDPNDV